MPTPQSGSDQIDRPGRDDPDHEALCRRCGVSCHLAVVLYGVPVMVPGLHCQFLAADRNGRYDCSVYAQRFDRAPWCHHADVGGPAGFLASDCPYTRGLDGVQGKVRLGNAALVEQWPDLLARMRAWGVPDFIDREALIADVSHRTGRQWRLTSWPMDSDRLRLEPCEDGGHSDD